MMNLGRVFIFCCIICLVLITSQLSTEPKLCGFIGSKNDNPFSPPTVSVEEDGLQELRTIEHNDRSCLSRYESPLYRKQSLHKPSSYLISRLRQYEALHKRCGPYTESYNRTIKKLESGQSIDDDHEPSDCKYLVRIASDGLGNRILSLASAFLYALITNRVLLVYDNKGDTFDLFCEPFPETTWFLPYDFPIRNRLQRLNTNIPEHYGNMLKNSSSSFVYLHLFHGYQNNGRHFFCDQGQNFLQNVTWVFVRSHFYYIPSLFLIESFDQELANLFPEKDKVFHFLSRYLFLPSNPVWDLVTRYYQAYLAKSDEKIGVQVRVFDPDIASRYYNAKFTSDQAVPDTVVTCLLDNNLLPKIDTNESFTIKEKAKSIAVLMTSLSPRYFQKIRDMYWEHSSVTRDVIGVFQASFEGNQNFNDKMHDRKAWAEMYLLSLTDKLITSPWSTFGYVAQGLAGLRPYILHMPNNETMSNPACTRAVSMEPCFHSPPIGGCSKDRSKFPHVSQCDDLKTGLKLVDPKA